MDDFINETRAFAEQLLSRLPNAAETELPVHMTDDEIEARLLEVVRAVLAKHPSTSAPPSATE